MTTPAVSKKRWDEFLRRYFAPPNELGGEHGRSAELDAMIGAATEGVARDQPLPVVLPARVSGQTEYLAIAFDVDQARLLRDLLLSHLGVTWTSFDGSSRATTPLRDALDDAGIDLAGGDPSLVFRFHVGKTARAEVRQAVQSLMERLAERPPREARINVPVGRLLGDFHDACADKAEQAARTAYARLAADHRLSAANRLFLQVELLAALEAWDELEALPALADVVQLERPALASDALARLALRSMPAVPTSVEFMSAGDRFGALISSVGSIRSASGARYYALWSLYSGDDPAVLRERLESTGWATAPGVVEVLQGASTVQSSVADNDDDLEQLRTELAMLLDAGRLDSAVDVLARLPMLERDLPIVLTLVRRTLTARATQLLDAYRDALGAEVVQAALDKAETPAGASREVVESVALEERVGQLLRRTSESRESFGEQSNVELGALSDGLMRGAIEAATAQVRAATALPTSELDLGVGFDVCLDFARDLRQSDVPTNGLGDFGFALAELWAFHDQSGDRHRLRRVIQLVDDTLAAGVSAGGFDEVVELLRAGWDPFLTDADLAVGLDTVELLLMFRPDGSEALDGFARPLLTRIGPHNSRRLNQVALEVAIDLAPLFGLEISTHTERGGSDDGLATRAPIPAGTVVALYSLMEPAVERAASVLRRRHPGLEVLKLADHVASERLRAAARSADVFVVMDRAAKHPATDAIRVERGGRRICFAMGKGSTSLVEAAEDGLAELAAASAA